GSIVLVADVAGGLRCYDLTEAPAGELTPIWAASLPVGRLIGPPVGRGQSVSVAAAGGALLSVLLDEGDTRVARLGEPLASAPAVVGDRLAVAATDGSILFVDPQALD
ncbi:MAG: PQQ-binding-like beta-propeller repeat protein, partial [Planctomycetota bacterium]